jgi:hypothetical protein
MVSMDMVSDSAETTVYISLQPILYTASDVPVPVDTYLQKTMFAVEMRLMK